MLYTANGTYDLPNNNDFNATVSPGLTAVTFILSDTAPASYNMYLLISPCSRGVACRVARRLT